MCHQSNAPVDAGQGAFGELLLADGHRVPTYAATVADGPAGRLPVVVVPDIFGINGFYTALVERLAAAGHPALCVDYFARTGEPAPGADHRAARRRRQRLDEAQALRDLCEVLTQTRPDSPGARLGLVGFCLGGSLALNAAARLDDLVTVAFYPFPRQRYTSGPDGVVPPIEEVAELRGPTLALWGSSDEAVGQQNITDYLTRATEVGTRIDSTIYPGVGHGFLAALDGDDAAAPVAAQAWQRALSHLAG
jgi:carboxymethylenebutenolidase